MTAPANTARTVPMVGPCWECGFPASHMEIQGAKRVVVHAQPRGGQCLIKPGGAR